MACKLPHKSSLKNAKQFLVQYGVIDSIDSDTIIDSDLFNLAVTKLQSDMQNAYGVQGVLFENRDMKLEVNNSVFTQIDNVRKALGLYDNQERYVINKEGATITPQIPTPEVTTAIKPGVAELFESNLELANAVYEAAGFTNLHDVINEVFGNVDEGTIENYINDGTWWVKKTLPLSEINLGNYGKFTEEEKTKYTKSLLEEGQKVPGIIDKKGKLTDGYHRYFSLKSAGIDNMIVYVPITSQQKQQAQILYSQYLDQIFPNSKVKDIVYHGTGEFNAEEILRYGFDKSLQGENKVIYFTADKKDSFGSMGGIVSAIVNIEKLFNNRFSSLVNKDENSDSFYFPTEEDVNSKIYNSVAKRNPGNIFKDKNDNISEVSVIEPEQIHILGSKQDIEGFQNFVAQPTTSTLDTNLAPTQPEQKLEDILMQLEIDAGLRHNKPHDKGRKRYVQYDKAFKEAVKFNKGPNGQEYEARMIKLFGEIGDNRVYYGVKVDRKDLGTLLPPTRKFLIDNFSTVKQNEAELSRQYFNGRQEASLDTVLKGIEQEGKYNSIVQHVRSLLSESDMQIQDMVMLQEAIATNVAAEYDPTIDRIIVYANINPSRDNSLVILHEIIHRITSKAFINSRIITYDNAIHKKGEDLLNIIKNALAEKYKSDYINNTQNTYYGLTNVDEFLSEGITNPELIKELKNLSYKKSSIIDLISDWIAGILNLEKKNSAYKEFKKYYDEVTDNFINMDVNNPMTPTIQPTVIENFEDNDGKVMSEEEMIFEQFKEFALKLNPNFNLEVLDDLLASRGINAVADIRNFTIKVQKGKGRHISEEIAHFYVELLPDHLLTPMLEVITYTRLYRDVVAKYRSVYGDDFMRLKKEAIAQMIALYMDNPQAAQYWSGTSSVWETIKRFVMSILQWIKGKRSLFQDFIGAANEIKSGDISRLSLEKAAHAHEMYSIQDNELETLAGTKIDKYDKIFLSINDTILDYQNYPHKTSPAIDLFLNDTQRHDFVSKASLTPLGKELKDKAGYFRGRGKFVLFTNMTVDEELLARMREIFGEDVEILHTDNPMPGMTYSAGTEPAGIDLNQYIEDLKSQNDKVKILFVDNTDRSDSIVFNPNVSSYNYKPWYPYYTAQEKFQMEETRKRKKALRDRFEKAYNQSIDIDLLSRILRIFTSKVRSDVKSIEVIESIVRDKFGKVDVNTFMDENGEIALPEEGARAIARAVRNNQYLDAMITFTESIEQIGAFFDNFNKDNFKSILDKIQAFDNTGDRSELDLALFEINKLSNMIKKWNDYIDGVLNVINASPGDMSVVVESLMKTKTSLERARVRLYNISSGAAARGLMPVFETYNYNKKALIKELNDMYRANPSPAIMERIKNEEALLVDEAMLVKVLMNEGVSDVNPLMMWLKSSADFDDPLLASVAITIRMAEQQVNYDNVKKVQDFATQIDEAKKGLSPSELAKLTVEEEHYVVVNGVKELKKSKALLNPYMNLHEYDKFFDEFVKATEEYQEISNQYNEIIKIGGRPNDAFMREYEEATKKYRKARQDWERWSRENFHGEYTQEYYTLYDSLVKSDEDYDRLIRIRDLQGKYYDQIQVKKAQLEIATGAEVEMLISDIKGLRSELRGLRSDYNNDGSLKTDEELKDAAMLREKIRIDMEIYQTKVDMRKFDTEFAAILLTVEDNDIHNRYVDLLEANDLQTLYKEALFNNDTAVVEWLDSNTMVKINDSFYTEKNEIFKTVENYKTRIAEIFESAGITLPQEDNLSQLWDQIFAITARYRDDFGVINGTDIPLEAQQLILRLQKQILEDLQEKYPLEDLRKINPALVKDVTELIGYIGDEFKNLEDLQSKVNTRYYQEELIDMMLSSGFDALLATKTGFQISHGTSTRLILNYYSQAIKDLIDAHPDNRFSIWFSSNHLETTVIEANEEGKDVEKFRYNPTYIWKEIQPKNKNHISRLPSEKFSSRKIKDKFKTKKDENTWDETLRMWKPKTSRYYNPAYTRLANSPNPQDKKLFKVLQLRTKYHLSNQDEAGSVGRLGYRLPYVAADPIMDRAKYWKSWWSMFKQGTNFFEEGEDNFHSDDSTAKKGLRSMFNDFFKVDAFNIPGYDYYQIAVPFTKYIDPDKVSDDIDFNLVKYGNGVSRAGRMLKLNPLFRIVDRSLEQSMESAARIVGLDPAVAGLSKSRRGNAKRLEALRFIIAKEIYGYNKAFELGKGVDKLINTLKSVNTFGVLGSTPAGAINILKNNIQGRLQNIINAQFYNWSDNKSMAKAAMYHKNNYFSFVHETTKPLDKRGIDYHIISFFNPMMTNEIVELIGRQGGAAKKALVNDNLYLLNKAGEFGLVVNSLYAHLFYTKVTNGTNVVSLKDILYVEDNQLKVKDGYINERTGQPINMDYLMRTQLAYRSVLQYVQGKVTEKTMLTTTTIGSAAMYFKGWLIPMLRRRFGAKVPNYMIGEDLEGYWRTSLKIFIGLIKEGRDHWSVLTPVEKQNFLTTIKEIGMMMLTSFIISALFGFDIDDEDKYDKLKEKGWLYNTALRIVLQAKGETESLSPMIGHLPGIGKLTIEGDFIPPVLSEGKNLIQNPFIMVNFLGNYIKFGNNLYKLLSGDEKAYYDRNIPIYNIEKGDSKAGHYLDKILGINGLAYSLENPEGRVMSYISVLRK